MNKKLIISFLVIVFAGTVLMAGFNWYMDIHEFFRVRSGVITKADYDDGEINERMLAVYSMRNNLEGTYDGIIVGGSKARPLSGELLKYYTGMNYLSCTAANGNFEYYENIIDYAVRHQGIKHVLLHFSGVETYTGLQPDINNRVPALLKGECELKDYAYYLFCNIGDSFNKLFDEGAPSPEERFGTADHKGTSPDDENNIHITDYMALPGGDWIGEARMRSANITGLRSYYEKIAGMGDSAKLSWCEDHTMAFYGYTFEDIFRKDKFLPYLEDNITHLKNIKKLCDNNGVELTVVIGGVSIIERAKYECPEYWEYLRRICEITDFYDFSYFCDINNNPYNFYTGNHHLDTISWVELASIYGYDPYGYGIHITGENINEYLTQRACGYYAMQEELERTGTLELPGLGGESDLTVLPQSFYEGLISCRP
ncbi:MAG: hypothetical protein ACI38A_00705 [Candidatus Ornithomonoglobus sp.]